MICIWVSLILRVINASNSEIPGVPNCVWMLLRIRSVRHDITTKIGRSIGRSNKQVFLALFAKDIPESNPFISDRLNNAISTSITKYITSARKMPISLAMVSMNVRLDTISTPKAD
jgi:hypothetical protein